MDVNGDARRFKLEGDAIVARLVWPALLQLTLGEVGAPKSRFPHCHVAKCTLVLCLSGAAFVIHLSHIHLTHQRVMVLWAGHGTCLIGTTHSDCRRAERSVWTPGCTICLLQLAGPSVLRQQPQSSAKKRSA